MILFWVLVLGNIWSGSGQASILDAKHEVRLDSIQVHVHITNIKTKEGLLALGFFEDQDSFIAVEPFLQLYYEKDKVRNGEITVNFFLPMGVYGISMLDDTNRNDEMDYNFLGIPKEGFGFSNYYHKGFRKPHFDLWKFEVKDKETPTIEITLRYI